MFDKEDKTLSFFKNPLQIQRAVLKEHEERMDGKYTVADPNNSFMSLLEASSCMTADSIRAVENEIDKLHPKRITKMGDLYKHIPDFISVNIQNIPAEIKTLELTLDKDYLIDNSLKYDENYNKVIIPKDTVFNIGQYEFGLHYPIELLINRRTRSITTVYDTSYNNPLYTLSNNVVTSNQLTLNSLDLITLSFPVYQFSRTLKTEDVIVAQGFNKVYKYTDKFYAVRAYDLDNGTELDITIANNRYDVYKPTVVISIDEENQTVAVNIPQLYLTSGSIGTKIDLEIYTTKGQLDIDISEITEEDISASFAFNSKNTTAYSSLLNKAKTILIYPSSGKIQGGRNSLGFKELRTRVINNTLYNSIPISPQDLQKYFQDKGYQVTKRIDNTTSRSYLGYKELLDKKGSLIPVAFTNINLTPYTIDGTSTIVTNPDDSITILPTTIYEFNNNTQISIPLTDSERNDLTNLTPTAFSEKLNGHHYTRSPFHIRVITESRYPRADTFNLNQPSIKNITFIKDNYTVGAQMTLATAAIEHLNEGTDGYLLRLGMIKSNEFANIPEEDVLVYVTTNTYTGARIGQRAVYQGILNNMHIYDLRIDTSYYILENNTLSIEGFRTKSGSTMEQYVNLTGDWDILVCVKKDVYMDDQNVTNDENITYDLANEYSVDFLGITRQRITCVLGEILSDIIETNVNVDTTATEYLRYNTNVPQVWSTDQYEFDEDGKLVIVDITDGVITLNKLAEAGDPQIIDGEPLIKYHVGDLKRDVYHNPMIDKGRSYSYQIESIQTNLKLFYSEDMVYKDFNKYLTEEIMSSVIDMREISSDILLERTDLFFQPIKTMGNGKFNLGDGTEVEMDLALKFDFTVYVQKYVKKDDALKDMIRQNILSIIDEHLTKQIISTTDIATDIKDTLGDYVHSVDNGGINNREDIQTIMVTETSTKPMLKNRLVYENNTFTIHKDVNIVFKSV